MAILIRNKCKYCNAEFNENELYCPSCGAKDFIRIEVVEEETPAPKRKSVPAIIITYLAWWIILITIGSIISVATGHRNRDKDKETEIETKTDNTFGISLTTGGSQGSSNTVRKELKYSDDLLERDDLYLGMPEDTNTIDYNIDIAISGSYDDLTENIIENLYAKQIYTFDYNIPISLEVNENDVEFSVNNLKVYETRSGRSLVVVDMGITGNIDNLDFYLEEEDGARIKFTLQSYEEKEYGTIEKFVESRPYRYNFNLSQTGVKYSSFVVKLNGETYKYNINYDKVKGYIEYWGLK